MAAGFGFQANVGAIAAIHVLRGTPVQWTAGLSSAPPRSVSFETSGPGDDISLELSNGDVVEIQVKKGLSANNRFWSTMESLCLGIRENDCEFGVLVVCPHSSRPVKEGYAEALVRIGDGRFDNPSPEQSKLKMWLQERDYDGERICSRLRIQTVSALESSGDAIAAAHAELGHICNDRNQLVAAWNALGRDALQSIASKGRRTTSSLAATLRTSTIDIKDLIKDSPAAVVSQLLRWTISQTEQFEILGVSEPLHIDTAWLQLQALIREEEVETASSVEDALSEYRRLGENSKVDNEIVDARTIGTFRRLCVILGGPGSGKSLLLRVLAREFALDSHVSLRVRLRDVVKRMESGYGVEESLFQLGLDATGVAPEQLRAAALPDLVLLCDGLDECGTRQADIVLGLLGIAASHPSYRILITTRPIGYNTTALRNWRHYEIAPLGRADISKHLRTLCENALANSTRQISKLDARIRAFLNKRNVSRIMGRSPLLLAFGTAVFLRWGDPGGSKTELYERVFQLVEGGTSDRTPVEGLPAKAIRRSVLHQLGWLLEVSPFAPLEELAKVCATTTSESLGTTFLNALSTVEVCIEYWESKGLIERLLHSGIEYIAFIHKTCGEFAASQHLSEMELHEVRDTIGKVLEKPDWYEILDFATSSGFATALVETLLQTVDVSNSDESTLNSLISALVRPELELSRKKARLFLRSLFSLATSEDRRKANIAGKCLTEHDLSQFPELESMARALVSAELEWSRLIGWAILVCHFPSSIDRVELAVVFADFLRISGAKDFFVFNVWVRPFGLIPERSVFENFLLGSLRILLAERDPEYQDRLVEDVQRSQAGATRTFIRRFGKLLRESGRDDLSKQWLRDRELLGGVDFSILRDYEEATEVMMRDAISAAFVTFETGHRHQTGAKHLAAFFEMAGILHTSASDAFVWTKDSERLSELHNLIREAAYVFGLSMERLGDEATEIVQTVEESRSKEGSHSILSMLPKVDTADIDWRRAQNVKIGNRLLERFIHHPSIWVQHLAASLLDERLEGKTRMKVCERLLSEGTGNTLYLAAALALECSGAESEKLLLDRLHDEPVAGLHHLFDHLKTNGVRATPAHSRALQNGLLYSDVETAVSAAQWCLASASVEDRWLISLLRMAMSHWQQIEEPYPEKSGVVPFSPREAILRILCKIDPPSFEELVELTADSRSDVANAAINAIVELAVASPYERSKLVDAVIQKRFDASHCPKLLSSRIPYETEELTTLFALSTENDPIYIVRSRYAMSWVIQGWNAKRLANSRIRCVRTTMVPFETTYTDY